MTGKDLDELELELLCKGIYEAYGYDFREYAQASFSRRIEQFVKSGGYRSTSHLLADVLHDKEVLGQLVTAISVTTSDMFRDPQVFQYIRKELIPYLKSFPHIRIWHAACANGEEVYSLAILLQEEEIYDRCSIYATDLNESALANVQKGIYPVSRIKDFSRNYQQAGGRGTLSDYYHARYDHAIFDRKLLKNITFANHNLTVDTVFMEAHLILCRNVMIYFNRELQNRVLSLLDSSLAGGGILCLGTKETLAMSPVESHFETLEREMKIYKKVLYA